MQVATCKMQGARQMTCKTHVALSEQFAPPLLRYGSGAAPISSDGSANCSDKLRPLEGRNTGASPTQRTGIDGMRYLEAWEEGRKVLPVKTPPGSRERRRRPPKLLAAARACACTLRIENSQ